MEKIRQYISAYLKEYPRGLYRENEPMKNHTSFRIGGPVPVMFFPKAEEELCFLRRLAAFLELEPLVLGNGTNLLAADQGLKRPVIKTGGLEEIKLADENTIEAGCGALLSVAAVFAQEHGLSGIEFAHGIPGSLGGAVSMNAGAYGGEIKDAAVSSRALVGEDLTVREYFGTEQEFSYRHSRYSDTKDIVLSAKLRLSPKDPGEIRERMDVLGAKRRASQPLSLPSAGSTFKRPAGGYAAALIDAAGLKGFAIGGAQVSEKHAGFVVNRGGATFEDVLRLMEHIKETVYRTSGIELAPEVKIIRN